MSHQSSFSLIMALETQTRFIRVWTRPKRQFQRELTLFPRRISNVILPGAALDELSSCILVFGRWYTSLLTGLCIRLFPLRPKMFISTRPSNSVLTLLPKGQYTPHLTMIWCVSNCFLESETVFNFLVNFIKLRWIKIRKHAFVLYKNRRRKKALKVYTLFLIVLTRLRCMGTLITYSTWNTMAHADASKTSFKTTLFRITKRFALL